MNQYHLFDTVAGTAGILWRAGGISGFRLPGSPAESTERSLLRRFPDASPASPPAEVAEVIATARRYFSGESVDFSMVRVDLGAQDSFYARVYARVRQLGRGETMTYGAVARELGAGPEAARAVGQAMASNPIPLIIPCHRVLGAGGKVGGFSAPGGSDSKLRMLALEGVNLVPPQAQQAFAF